MLIAKVMNCDQTSVDVDDSLALIKTIFASHNVHHL